MNYSTLKKTVALSCVALLAVGAANAQTAMSDSTKTTGTAKTFGGLGQYKTWSVGVNLGVTAPSVATGGVNNFNHNQPSLGYGISLRDQLSHAFGLQLDVSGGKVKGSDNAKFNNPGYTIDSQTGLQVGSFSTTFWQGTLSAVANVGSLSFMHRTNAINF
ncbi:MAG: OmpA family protein, partial [Mucilaginibacter sp.]